ncbi:MAG: metal ABC transporter ATP-binding protein [Verrucomicrobia bacterium]|nr:metal ABC transporter ATP-binding protein [Verrucomicrobiota bacterium]
MSRGLPVVSIRGLRVSLGGQEVLRGVDFEVNEGELVALIGPNGSGKTTLLRCLLRLQGVQAGEIRLWGCPPTPPVLRRVGYVPQRLNLEPSFVLSVREFLALKRQDTRTWFVQRKSTTDHALERWISEFDLRSLLDRPVARLSGGQLQRVLIAFSLLNDPELVVFDEPTAGVDTPGEQSFYEMIGEVQSRRKITALLVSHDLSMVYRHASRVVALNGVVCCEGTPEEVMNAESLKAAYGIHVAPYHHHHHHGHPHDHPHLPHRGGER